MGCGLSATSANSNQYTEHLTSTIEVRIMNFITIENAESNQTQDKRTLTLSRPNPQLTHSKLQLGSLSLQAQKNETANAMTTAVVAIAIEDADDFVAAGVVVGAAV